MSGCSRAYFSFIPGIPIIACFIPESGREGDLCATVEISVCAGRLVALAVIVMGHEHDWKEQKGYSLSQETGSSFSSFTYSKE